MDHWIIQRREVYVGIPFPFTSLLEESVRERRKENERMPAEAASINAIMGRCFQATNVTFQKVTLLGFLG